MRTDVESFFFSARVCALGGNCLEFCFGFLNILFERVYEADKLTCNYTMFVGRFPTPTPCYRGAKSQKGWP